MPPTHYSRRVTRGDEEIDLEIGDSRNMTEFRPLMRIRKWAGDIDFRTRLNVAERGVVLAQGIGSNQRIIWRGNDMDAHFYEVGEGMEFDIRLKSLPASNVIRMPIETRGLSFGYQKPFPEIYTVGVEAPMEGTPTLVTETEVQFSNGSSSHRPIEVSGSIAAYYNGIDRGLNTARQQRKAGKAFHIYRPKCIDDNGVEEWAGLAMDRNNLIITIPQAFLNTAAYPVIVDPTFGVTSVGGSFTWFSDRHLFSEGTPSSSGTLDKLTIYSKRRSAGMIRPAVYEVDPSSDLADYTRVDYGDEVDPGTSAGWDDYTLSGSSITGGTLYAISAWVGPSVGSDAAPYWDDPPQGTVQWTIVDAYHATNAPTTPLSHADVEGRTFSIYATYTEGAAGRARYFDDHVLGGKKMIT